MRSGYRPRDTARRQALAERHKPRDAPQSMPGGRLHGRCELCGEIHRSPTCGTLPRLRPGGLRGPRAGTGYVCPDCGTGWRSARRWRTHEYLRRTLRRAD